MENKNILNNSTIIAKNAHIGDNYYSNDIQEVDIILLAMTLSDIESLHGKKVKDLFNRTDNCLCSNYEIAFQEFQEFFFDVSIAKHYYGLSSNDWTPFCMNHCSAINHTIETLINNILQTRNIKPNYRYIQNQKDLHELKTELDNEQLNLKKIILIFDAIALFHTNYQYFLRNLIEYDFGGIVTPACFNLLSSIQPFIRGMAESIVGRWCKNAKTPDNSYYLHLADEFLFRKLILSTLKSLGYKTEIHRKLSGNHRKDISDNMRRL